jgi:hypothetical protein
MIAFLLQQHADRGQDVLVVVNQRDIGHSFPVRNRPRQYKTLGGKAKGRGTGFVFADRGARDGGLACRNIA